MATSAEKYNNTKAGDLWSWGQLPVHFRDHATNPTAFAKRVRVFQALKGLVADGRLGPKTINAVWLEWPNLKGSATAQADTPKPKPKAKAKAKPKAEAKADQPDGVLLVDGDEDPVPLE